MIPRAARLALLALVLAGCGGSSGKDGNGSPSENGNPRVSIAWPARSRAVQAPASAQSAVITLQLTDDSTPPLTYGVDRPTGDGAVVRTVVAPTDLAPGRVLLTVDFFAGSPGASGVVATANVDATLRADGTLLRPDGKPLGEIAFTGTLSRLEVAQSAYLDVGETAELVVSATGRNGYIALAPGSAKLEVTSGADVLKLRGGAKVDALREGVATVVATVDGLTSAPTAIVVQGAALTPRALDLTANALVADPTRGTVWASVLSGSGLSNVLVDIDPATGAYGPPIPLAGTPGPLALSDDGTTLFVGLNSERTVRPVDLLTRTPGVAFSVAAAGAGDFPAQSIAVQPGSASTVAVTTGSGPFGGKGPVVYDAGVPRPNGLADYQNGYPVWTSRDRILAFTSLSDSPQIFDVAVSPEGTSLAGTDGYEFPGIVRGAVLANGRVYTTTGVAFDAASRAFLGRFDLGLSRFGNSDGIAGPVVDAAANRAFFVVLGKPVTRLLAFRLDTFAPIAANPLAGLPDSFGNYRIGDLGLVRAGARRLAFHTADRVFIIDDVPGL